jgi:hypothetical protein
VDGTGEIHLYVDELFAYRPVPFTTREWYCPQVGLVTRRADGAFADALSAGRHADDGAVEYVGSSTK